MKYTIKTFSTNEFSHLLCNYMKQDIAEDIKYFSYNDLSTCFLSDSFMKTCKYVVVYNKDVILGICKMAVYENSKEYVSISYLSVHKKYQNKGIGKKLIDKSLDVVKTYNMPFNTSQYTVAGWKYLRPHIIEGVEKRGIEYKDNIIGHGDCDDEFRKLRQESIKIFQEKYQTENYYY